MSRENLKNDLVAEKMILSYLMQHGSKVYSDVDVYLKPDAFSSRRNQGIYSCISNILEAETLGSITVDLILSTAKELNLSSVIGSKDDTDYLDLCLNTHVNMSELQSFIRKVVFWSLHKKLISRLESTKNMLETCSGEEKIIDVVAKAEENIFDFIPSILNEEEVVELGDFAADYVEYLGDNPVEMAGLPTGFPRHDAAIGGGMRRGAVHIIAARPKVGKSTICLNIARHLSSQNIPVLYLDTELRKETQAIRWMSLNSEVDQNKIETGKFTQEPNLKQKIVKTSEEIRDYPFDHVNISGKSVEEYQSLMRRWINKKVGFDENGRMKDCLIVLDYLKTMDLGHIGSHQEYQYLGDSITKLQNFAAKHDLPVLTAVQLNRDGIDKNDTAGVSGSDRLVWLCSSLTYLKRKSPEDYSTGDNENNGDRKLLVIETRYGSGMDITTDYINVISKLDHCKFIEGKYHSEVLNDNNSLDEHDSIVEGLDGIEL